MKDGRPIVIGTRGSPLALAQANIVLRLLKKKNPNSKFQLQKIKTDGDSPKKRFDSAFTGKDLFTRAIDKALEEKTIDIAVHSLKDVPAESGSSNIEIAAFPKRSNPFDVLVSNRGVDSLETLPRNARIGTSSIRRAIQLKSFRPDFEIVEIHGNVQSRIDKLGANLDAVVLAKAGLKRLGIGSKGKLIPSSQMLPAVGQGCLAVAIRKDDHIIEKLVKKIDDRDTRLAVSAERAFSEELGGGCNTPIATFAKIRGGRIFLEGLFEGATANNSKMIVRSRVSGSIRNPERLGKLLAVRLKKIASGN